jgi:hypothetical protein
MKIALYARQLSENNHGVAIQLIGEILNRGAMPIIYQPLFNQLKSALKNLDHFELYNSGSEIRGKVDFLFSIGGDGTILDTLTQVQDSGIPVLGINVGRLGFLSSISTQEINTIQKSETKVKEIDPIITMFKNVKRNRDFNISIQIENKIPRLDFIEMMEDSYNTSIIEFLSEEFTELLLKDIDSIKARFVTEIKNLVYNKEKNTEEVLSEIKKTEPTIRPKAKTTRTKKNELKND